MEKKSASCLVGELDVVQCIKSKQLNMKEASLIATVSPKDLLVCLLASLSLSNSSNVFAWLMSFETVAARTKGDTAGVFEEKFLADNFDSLVAIEKMVGAVLAFSSSCLLSALSSPLQQPLFPVIFNVELKHEVVNLPKFGSKNESETGSEKGA